MSCAMVSAVPVMALSYRSVILDVGRPMISKAVCVMPVSLLLLVTERACCRKWWNSTAGWAGPCFTRATGGGGAMDSALSLWMLQSLVL